VDKDSASWKIKRTQKEEKGGEQEEKEKEADSYYFADDPPIIAQDPDFINCRDNLYPQFAIDIYRDGGAIKIKNVADSAVIFDSEEPAATFHKLLAVIMGMDAEFVEDAMLWEFTKRNLRWKLRDI